MSWFVATLRQYPEIALFLSLGIGYWVGGKSFKGFSLGSVTATLLAAIAIGQLGIKVSGDLKATFFLLFLFAIGYGVGPQFVRGITKDGIPQAIYAVIVCLFCLGAAVGVAKVAGYDAGTAAGLFAGSQTISASMGLATDSINRLGLAPDQSKAMLDIMPTAYAITYIFGTVGSAIVIAMLGPILLRIDLKKACKEYEQAHGGDRALGGLGDAWQAYQVRAFKIAADSQVVGKTVDQVEGMFPDEARMFVLRVRRDGALHDATADVVLQTGDVASVVGPREEVIALVGRASPEVDDPELLSSPIEGIDVYVTNKEADGKTLEELGKLPGARGVYIRSIKRGLTETQIPVLAETKLYRGDVISLVGRSQDTAAAGKALGVIDRPTDIADVAFIGIAITIGALIGAVVIKVAGIPLTLSTAGGALILGIISGWYRATRPTFGRIPCGHVVVHELRWSQHVHRRDRADRRTQVRCRPSAAWIRDVLVGHRRYDGAAHPRYVSRQIRFPLPRRDHARRDLRSANDDGIARHGLRRRRQPGSRSRLHRDVRGRKHLAYDLGHVRRAPRSLTHCE